MNIMLISQCSKNALTETRRILDQFAERRGDRTWQTAITQQGLETLHRLLRQTARKNTAVACHWIRGKDHSELIWVVGDARQFNARGASPTNMTQRDVLRAGDENDWHSAEDIRLLARLAALFHDFGKASDAFQKKLKSDKPIADAFRHEWVSLRLFEAFIGPEATDRDWLTRLTSLPVKAGEACITALHRDGMASRPSPKPFKGLPPLAQVVGWLIVSHHRMPTKVGGGRNNPLLQDEIADLPRHLEHAWCGSREANTKEIEACWRFPKGLPMDGRHWREHAAKVAAAILQRPSLVDEAAPQVLGNPYVQHISRLALMLADHYYSAQDSSPRYGDKAHKSLAGLYANTGFKDGKRILKQRLDEHLIGVAVSAGRILGTLPRLETQLPRIARHKGFRERSKGDFRWQNAAFDLAEGLQARSARQGFFGINMASTGCGKTLANGRILYALADPQLGARFTVALGLRTLTLQTGDAYRERLRLGPEDLAVLVGGGATRALHEYQGRQAEMERARNGSESAAPLLPDCTYVHYEGSLEDGPLKRWLGENSDALRLLDAPVLACTIDHLMPATEGTRGGHQIAPMLRLMTSDLVLDEPDDFGIEDLPALTRLVHWAGLLGSRVLLSSATLPPALVKGLFHAYLAGRREYQRNRGVPGERLAVCCAWFDEFAVQAAECADGDSYQAAHGSFVDKRLAKLALAEVRRRAEIKPLSIKMGQPRETICTELAGILRGHLHTLHSRHHSIDPRTGKRVSFGLIRMANIDPLFDVAQELFRLGAEEGARIHLCVYHSRHPMLVRAGIEAELDGVLKRHRPDEVFERESLRRRLDAGTEQDHIFVVLATAVAEVGRDHDYDWAIVEPSSMRSIIQLAGRVRRHRPWQCPEEKPNLYLLDTNVLHLAQGGSKPAFLRPGFENERFALNTHRLVELLTPEQWRNINAAARIKERDTPMPQQNLVDLEHDRLRDKMLGADPGKDQRETPAHLWWTTRAHLSGELQRETPFRNDPQGRQHYVLLPDDGEKLHCYRLEEGGGKTDVGFSAQGFVQPVDLPSGPGIKSWGVPDYIEALQELAEYKQLELGDCAFRFGIVDLPERAAGQGWRYHPVLGFSRTL